VRLYLKNTESKKNWGMAQVGEHVLGPEFNPQYHQNKQTKKRF
jgi:hypothetical protein